MVLLIVLASFSLFMPFRAWAPAAAFLFIYKRLNVPAPDVAYGYWRVLKWPALAGIISFWITDLLLLHERMSSDVFLFALFLGYWICLRNVGHDKNQKKKTEPRVRARLKQIGGRLVVVPERMA